MTNLGPNFFLVGAPKCGTTALHAYLDEHPQIYMARKEQHFFGSDLAEIFNLPPGLAARPDSPTYFGLFAGTDWAMRRGDASVWYLWSRTAAAEIHDYDPRAKIIAMLRNPVDMLASLHSQYVHDGIEDINSFAGALAAEPDRRAGRRIPPNNNRTYPWRLFYRDVARFHEQLARYFAKFPREQVHVVLYDDFARDTLMTYQKVLAFLDVEPLFVPTQLRVINSNKRIRSRLLQRLVWDIQDPSSPLRTLGSRVIPIRKVRSTLLRTVPSALRRFNSVAVARPPVAEDLRLRLSHELSDDIHKLEDLLGRDLSYWLGEAAPHGVEQLRPRPRIIPTT